MTQAISTNNLSLITQDNINKNQSALSSSIERLSSDLHINSAKDDAVGQAIANRFASNVKGLTQAARGANDGTSVAQVTEGVLSEINNNLRRVRELTVQASTGTNSDSDLNSIQDEIKSRLDEIDRVSGQTQFNGVNVLARNGSMKIQVGANDSQTITIDLKKIDSDTLGLNGFNVSGSDTVASKAATISDLTVAKTDVTTNTITTTNSALTASEALDQLKDGDTATIKADAARTTTVYTYNASAGNFSFGNVSNNTSVKAGDVATDLLPPAGQTAGGVYKAANGEVDFDADTNGKTTIGGQETYLTSDGDLATSDVGDATTVTLDGLLKKAGDGQPVGFNKTASVTIGGTIYNFKTGADAGTATANAKVPPTDTVSKEIVLNKVAAAKQDTAVAANGDTSAAITYKSGVQTYQAVFAADDDTANTKYTDNTDVSNITATYADADGEMTTVDSYTTKYSIDANNGKITADSGTGAGKYAPKVGAEVHVSTNDTLTTDATSEGVVTRDPLRALDEAINPIDKFRSSLGAIQNRLDPIVINPSNATTNLSKAQSRTQDADYAAKVSNMSKAQIIQQASNSVLTKASQVLQQVLFLLRG